MVVRIHRQSTIQFVIISLLALALISPELIPNLASANKDEFADNVHYLPIVATSDCTPLPHISPDNPDKDKSIEDGINKIREANSLLILINDSKITQAALRHSNDMANNKFTGHTGSDGSGPGDRLNEACFNANGWGEIIAWGYAGRPQSVINAWMNSPPHKSIILKEWYDVFGAGYVNKPNSKWKHYWTVDFSLRRTEDNSNPERLFACKYISEDDEGGILLKVISEEPCDLLFSDK